MKYSEIINSVNYGLLRNNDPRELRKIFMDYAEKETMRLDKIGKVTYSIIDLWNKTELLNPQGFIEYLETKVPQKHFIGALQGEL